MRLKRHEFINLLSSVAAAWPLAVHAQPAQEITATPKIEIVRVKSIDPAPKIPFLLGDDVIDLMKEFSLGGLQGIGSAWKTPPYIVPFDLRYGQW